MTHPVRAALVGFGYAGRTFHAPLIAACPDLRLEAVVSRQAEAVVEVYPDARVLASTKMIGGGESTKATFAGKALKAGGEYSFFCSFPGHEGLMHGTVKLVD